VAIGPGDTIDVEPHVDRAGAHAHQIVEPVAVDVPDAELGRAHPADDRRAAHGDVAIGGKAGHALGGAPGAVTAARPVANVARARAHDVHQTVAVHLGQVHVLVREEHRRGAPRRAREARLVAQRRGGRARPGGLTERAVAARESAQREGRLVAGGAALDDVDQTIAIHVGRADLRVAKVDQPLLDEGPASRARGPQPGPSLKIAPTL
jgi:hypothetical protein